MIWLGVNQCFAPLPCTVYLVMSCENLVVRSVSEGPDQFSAMYEVLDTQKNHPTVSFLDKLSGKV